MKTLARDDCSTSDLAGSEVMRRGLVYPTTLSVHAGFGQFQGTLLPPCGLGSQPSEGCAAKPGPSPTGLGFTRDRINSAQVGQARLALIVRKSAKADLRWLGRRRVPAPFRASG